MYKDFFSFTFAAVFLNVCCSCVCMSVLCFTFLTFLSFTLTFTTGSSLKLKIITVQFFGFYSNFCYMCVFCVAFLFCSKLLDQCCCCSCYSNFIACLVSA